MNSSKQHTALDDIFDPSQGWSFPPERVPLQRVNATDGSPYYIVTVDGIELEVFEQTHWASGEERTVSAGRLVAMTTFIGVELTDPLSLLKAAFDTRGLPSFGIDDAGRITLQSAFPYSSGFPNDHTRQQLMVCMGIVSEEVKQLLVAWNQPVGNDWQIAKGVASVAGAFIRGFAGG